VPSLKNSAILPKTKATARSSSRQTSCHISFIKPNCVIFPKRENFGRDVRAFLSLFSILLFSYLSKRHDQLK
jgi:hypothetical protein